MTRKDLTKLGYVGSPAPVYPNANYQWTTGRYFDGLGVLLRIQPTMTKAVLQVKHTVDRLPCSGEKVTHCFVKLTNEKWLQGPDHTKGSCPLCEYTTDTPKT